MISRIIRLITTRAIFQIWITSIVTDIQREIDHWQIKWMKQTDVVTKMFTIKQIRINFW